MSTVDTTVKSQRLVERRRAEICASAVQLARRRSFALTTTREIAKAANMNVATMYQYVRSKEDIIYLVCAKNIELLDTDQSVVFDTPVSELRTRFEELMQRAETRQHEISFVYLESRTLSGDYLERVKAWDEASVDFLEAPLIVAVEAGLAAVDNTRLAARQMLETSYAWANKRWSLHRSATYEEYTEFHWLCFSRAFEMEEERQ